MDASNDLLLAYLQQNNLFSEMDAQQLIALAPIQHFKKGTILLKEGQRSKAEYFVLKGCLRAYYMVDGEEKTTEFYSEFEPVSPICIAKNEPSDYYLTCLEDAILIVSDASIQQDAFEQLPNLKNICLQMTEQILAQKQIALNNFKINSPEQRYLNLLDSNPALIQRVPQYQLASYLGITPQSLSRLRNRLIKK